MWEVNFEKEVMWVESGDDLITVIKYSNGGHGKRDYIYSGLLQRAEQGSLGESYQEVDLAQHAVN